MDIYEVFNNLRYHHEDEVVEFKQAGNNFDFDDLAYLRKSGKIELIERKMWARKFS